MKLERSGPKLNAADINDFERLLGAKLPADYRSFLLKHNGGKPHPANFEQTVSNQVRIVNCVQRFYPLLRAPDGKQSDLREEWHEARRELKPGWLPIASDSAGEAICVRLEDPDYGAVHVTDGYVEYLGHKPNMRRLADSFKGFIDTLFDQEQREPIDHVRELATHGTREDVLQYLAKGGKMTDKTQFGRSIAESAAAHGNLDVLRYCLESGTVISGALTVAVLNSRWEAMRLLVESGADVNKVDSVSGKTPLQAVREIPRFICKERDSIEQYLRDHGAKG
jgi:hypothetical protein